MAHGEETGAGGRQGFRIGGFSRCLQDHADPRGAGQDGRQDRLATARMGFVSKEHQMSDRNEDSGERRRLMHRRSVECEGYLRHDGLWEVEARLVDTKPFVQHDRYRGVLQPGEPVHDISLRLAIDDRMTIIEAETTMRRRPIPPASKSSRYCSAWSASASARDGANWCGRGSAGSRPARIWRSCSARR